MPGIAVPVGTPDCEYVEVEGCTTLLEAVLIVLALTLGTNADEVLCADVSEIIPKNAASVFIVVSATMIRLVPLHLPFSENLLDFIAC